jgi:hypothetical protein
MIEESESDYARLSFKNSFEPSYWTIAGLNGNVNANERLNFYNSTKGDIMSLTGNGNVGINNYNPQAKLDVYGGQTGIKVQPTDFYIPGLESKLYGIDIKIEHSDPIYSDDIIGIKSSVNYGWASSFIGEFDGNFSRANFGSVIHDDYYWLFGIYGGYIYTYGNEDHVGLFIECDDYESPGDAVGIHAAVDKFGDVAGLFYGDVQYSGGLYDISDQMFKENIKEYSGALEKLLKVKTKTYDYKIDEFSSINFGSNSDQGFIAQEFEEIFPELVKNSFLPASMDATTGKKTEKIQFKAVNYVGLIPVIVSAMQEQQSEIDSLNLSLNSREIENIELTNAIEDLQIQMAELKNIVLNSNIVQNNSSKGADNYNTSVTLMHSDAWLEQNIPNPFSGSTVIRCNIPNGFNSAEIMITSKAGEIIKRINLDQSGINQITIESSTIAAGGYQYTLVIDGVVNDTKQMLLTK